MTGYLLDANVLIALMFPNHESHQHARAWFQRNSHEGWVTCPFTEAAFVRIVSNAAVFPEAVELQQAVALLEENLQDARHRFWADDVSVAKAVQPFFKRLKGHKQVTDAYLLGLALHKKGRLVSLDRGILDLLPAKGMERDLVVLI